MIENASDRTLQLREIGFQCDEVRIKKEKWRNVPNVGIFHTLNHRNKLEYYGGTVREILNESIDEIISDKVIFNV